MTKVSIPLALAVALTAAGCVETTARRPGDAALKLAGATATPAPNSSAATWQMPWQLSPSSSVSAAKGEQTILAWVPETGFVRGTQTALASLGRPLQPVPGPNRTVGTCRAVVLGEASKIGAKEVEAVSGGPQRRGPKGQYIAPVHMRVTYASLGGGYEVRDSMLTCIVDKRGKIVDAYT